MNKYQFWFIVGSQFLYGPEVLETVEARAKEMAAELSKVLPYPLVYKVTAKTNKEITDVVKEANYDDSCAGIVAWCHTFSPSKMWINGLNSLQKPYPHRPPGLLRRFEAGREGQVRRHADHGGGHGRLCHDARLSIPLTRTAISWRSVAPGATPSPVKRRRT